MDEVDEMLFGGRDQEEEEVEEEFEEEHGEDEEEYEEHDGDDDDDDDEEQDDCADDVVNSEEEGEGVEAEEDYGDESDGEGQLETGFPPHEDLIEKVADGVIKAAEAAEIETEENGAAPDGSATENSGMHPQQEDEHEEETIEASERAAFLRQKLLQDAAARSEASSNAAAQDSGSATVGLPWQIALTKGKPVRHDLVSTDGKRKGTVELWTRQKVGTTDQQLEFCVVRRLQGEDDHLEPTTQRAMIKQVASTRDELLSHGWRIAPESTDALSSAESRKRSASTDVTEATSDQPAFKRARPTETGEGQSLDAPNRPRPNTAFLSRVLGSVERHNQRVSNNGADGTASSTASHSAESAESIAVASAVFRESADQTLHAIEQARKNEGAQLLHKIAAMYGLRVDVHDQQ